jgi:phage-related tail protein
MLEKKEYANGQTKSNTYHSYKLLELFKALEMGALQVKASAFKSLKASLNGLMLSYFTELRLTAFNQPQNKAYCKLLPGQVINYLYF